MNLLALLERRMPPEIPPGIGRVVMFDGKPLMEDKPAHTVKKIEGQMENRRNILAAIADGLQLTHEICKRTGLCKTSVFNHCNVLAQQGLVRIERGKVVNTYHIAKPKRGRGEK